MSNVAGFSTVFEAFDSSFNQKAAGYLNLELGTKSVGNIQFKSNPEWIQLSGNKRGDAYFLSNDDGSVAIEVTSQVYLPGGFSGSMWFQGGPVFLNAWAAKG